MDEKQKPEPKVLFQFSQRVYEYILIIAVFLAVIAMFLTKVTG